MPAYFSITFRAARTSSGHGHFSARPLLSTSRKTRIALRITTLFPGDGFGVDQPMPIAGPARLLLFRAGKTSETDEAADICAGGIQQNGCFLRGKPAITGCAHERSSGGRNGARSVHSNGMYLFWQQGCAIGEREDEQRHPVDGARKTVRRPRPDNRLWRKEDENSYFLKRSSKAWRASLCRGGAAGPAEFFWA